MSHLLRTGVDVGNRRIVIDGLGTDRFDDRNLIGNRLRVRQQIADPGAVLPTLPHAC